MTSLQRIINIVTNRTFWTTVLTLCGLFAIYVWITFLIMMVMIVQLAMLFHHITS